MVRTMSMLMEAALTGVCMRLVAYRVADDIQGHYSIQELAQGTGRLPRGHLLRNGSRAIPAADGTLNFTSQISWPIDASRASGLRTYFCRVTETQNNLTEEKDRHQSA